MKKEIFIILFLLISSLYLSSCFQKILSKDLDIPPEVPVAQSDKFNLFLNEINKNDQQEIQLVCVADKTYLYK